MFWLFLLLDSSGTMNVDGKDVIVGVSGSEAEAELTPEPALSEFSELRPSIDSSKASWSALWSSKPLGSKSQNIPAGISA